MSTLEARRAALNIAGRRHGGDRWRGRIPIPRRAHPLVRRLFEEMNRQEVTLTELAAESGFERGTISDWRYRRAPKVDHLEAALNVLGLRLTVARDDA
jgi:hypothetical protein